MKYCTHCCETSKLILVQTGGFRNRLISWVVSTHVQLKRHMIYIYIAGKILSLLESEALKRQNYQNYPGQSSGKVHLNFLAINNTLKKLGKNMAQPGKKGFS